MAEKEEGKNIHIVFADNGPRPTDEVDHEDRSEDSLSREEIYDNEISPIMTQLIEKCKEHKMPLFIECEYNPGDFCKTVINLKDWNSHAVFTTLDVITRCIQDDGVNIDKYLFWVIKQLKEAGSHGSMFLMQLGYRSETGEYDWDLANNMLQGAKHASKKEKGQNYVNTFRCKKTNDRSDQ